MKSKRLIIHLGLPKTGTTYLQQSIFPHLEGVTFLGKAKNVNIWDIMSAASNRYLISSEHLLANPFEYHLIPWYRRFHDNMLKLKNHVNDPLIILTLRKHESLLLSYYKEYISKGNRSRYPDGLSDFMPVDNNSGGYIRYRDLEFKWIIQTIISEFNTKPLVILQETIFNDINTVISQFEEYMDVNYHSGGNEYQKIQTNIGVKKIPAQLLLKANKMNLCSKKFLHLDFHSKFFTTLGINPDQMFRRKMAGLFKSELAFSPEESKHLSDYYRNDWEYVVNYIKAENWKQ